MRTTNRSLSARVAALGLIPRVLDTSSEILALSPRPTARSPPPPVSEFTK
jgi:hypothetical protein